MAPHPDPVDLVPLSLLVECFPEVAIDNLLLFAVLPPCLLPAEDPARHPFAEVLRVTGQPYLAGAFEGLEAGEGGGQFHSVVGGHGGKAGELLFMLTVTENRPPAPGTGVA